MKITPEVLKYGFPITWPPRIFFSGCAQLLFRPSDVGRAREQRIRLCWARTKVPLRATPIWSGTNQIYLLHTILPLPLQIWLSLLLQPPPSRAFLGCRRHRSGHFTNGTSLVFPHASHFDELLIFWLFRARSPLILRSVFSACEPLQPTFSSPFSGSSARICL